MLKEKVIELSKTKILFLIGGSIAFVILGSWFLTMDIQTIENQRKFNSPEIVYGVGIVTMIFFGLCGLIGIKKLLSKSPGLILNSDGVVDCSSGISHGMIPWAEVVAVSEYKVQRQKFVSIHVKDPEKYVDSGNIFKRMANKANLKMCGTPINISANALQISYDELIETIDEYFKDSQKKG